MNKDLKIKHGFTLAEVLITLGIIGVVAAMTMPTLIQKQREKQTVARLKSTYSILEQAYQRAIQENGTPDTWGLVSWESINNMSAEDKAKVEENPIDKMYFKYLKTTKICKKNTDKCGLDIKYKHLNGDNSNIVFTPSDQARIATRLANGSLIYMLVQSRNCASKWGNSEKLKNICGNMRVDINGFTGPNQWGIDTFMFVFTKYGIVPGGDPGFTSYLKFSEMCRDRTLGDVRSFANGSGCAAWVIANENMDYLHCDDLSWKGKHSCK